MKSKIVLVPFPFDDLSSSKVRPALCLSHPIGPLNHVITAFITTQTGQPLLDSDLLITASHPDFALTGLRSSSIVKLEKLMTFQRVRFVKELGKISPTLQTQVTQKLVKLFGL